MSFLPDELRIDDTVDTHRMAPEDDFASPADRSIPRKHPNATTGDGSTGGDSYYGAQSPQQFYPQQTPGFQQPYPQDLSAQQFAQPGHPNLPNAFTQPQYDQMGWQPRPEPEMVGDIPRGHMDQGNQYLVAGNEPAVNPGEDEGYVDVAEFPEELLNAAGLTEEQARADFGTVEAVQSAVRMFDRRMVDQGKSSLIAQQAANAQQDIVVDEPFQMPEPEGSDDWDDDTKKLVGAMTNQFNTMLAKQGEGLRAQQEAIAAQLQEQNRRAAEQELAEFDALVNSLPDEYVGILGRGTVYDLQPGSLAFQNRVHLDQTMNSLREGLRLSGRPAVSTEELMARSIGIAFPEVQKTVIRNEVVQEVDQRQQMMTARPTQRRQAAMSPIQKAGQTAEEWYRKHNMASDDLDEFEL